MSLCVGKGNWVLGMPHILIACLLLLLVPGYGFASGSYMARPPRPPMQNGPEEARYEVGKAIFTRKMALPERHAAAPRDKQMERLRQLQNKLPAQARSGVDLTGLAGRLSPGQFQALEHYLAVRYKIQ